MSTTISCSAAFVALPRERALAPVSSVMTPSADLAWRGLGWSGMTGSTKRGLIAAAAQDGRTGLAAGTYVTANPAATKQHFSIRSGPPTDRP